MGASVTRGNHLSRFRVTFCKSSLHDRVFVPHEVGESNPYLPVNVDATLAVRAGRRASRIQVKVVTRTLNARRLDTLTLKIFVVGAVEVRNAPVRLELDDPGGQTADELAVVRDEDQSAGVLLQSDL